MPVERPKLVLPLIHREGIQRKSYYSRPLVFIHSESSAQKPYQKHTAGNNKRRDRHLDREVISSPQSPSKCPPGAHQARSKNKREQRENDECPHHCHWCAR